MTRYLFLLGHPLKHSYSAKIYNEIFKRNAIDVEYTALDVKESELYVTVKRLLQDRYCIGFNITIPYKQAIREFVRETEAARVIGAVNVVSSSKQLGENTDWIGFLDSLHSEGVKDIRSATIIGAGGGARAVLYALLRSGTKRIFIVNRTVKRAKALTMQASRLFPEAKIEAKTFQESTTAVSESEILVNATPIGQYPDTEEMPPIDTGAITEEKVVYDLVYNPSPTKLLEVASSKGAKAIGGLGMLLWQAYHNLKFWGFNDTIAEELIKEGKRIVKDDNGR